MIKEFRGEYRFLSNFFPCEVRLEGIVYPSSEHAYMAQKTTDVRMRMWMAGIAGAAEAKKAGRALPLRPGWDGMKQGEMLKVVKAKFEQNPHLAQMLVQTGDQELIEGNWWGDAYWGVDLKTGKGENFLGKTLMLVRDMFKVKAALTGNKIVIAGSRGFTDHALMVDRLQALEEMGLVTASTTLICGMARGADMLGHKIFKAAGLPIVEMPADWEGYGKSAGYRRNAEMAAIADLALVFWDGTSPGTKHMIDTMERLKKPVYLVRY